MHLRTRSTWPTSWSEQRARVRGRWIRYLEWNRNVTSGIHISLTKTHLFLFFLTSISNTPCLSLSLSPARTLCPLPDCFLSLPPSSYLYRSNCLLVVSFSFLYLFILLPPTEDTYMSNTRGTFSPLSRKKTKKHKKKSLPTTVMLIVLIIFMDYN